MSNLETKQLNANALCQLPKSRAHSFFYYQTSVHRVYHGFERWTKGQTVFYQLHKPEGDYVYVGAYPTGLDLFIPCKKIICWRVFPNQKTPSGKPRRELVYRMPKFQHRKMDF